MKLQINIAGILVKSGVTYVKIQSTNNNGDFNIVFVSLFYTFSSVSLKDIVLNGKYVLIGFWYGERNCKVIARSLQGDCKVYMIWLSYKITNKVRGRWPMKSLLKSTLIATVLALFIWEIVWFVENYPILLFGGTLGVLFFGVVILLKNYRALESDNPTYHTSRFKPSYRTWSASGPGKSIEKPHV